MLNNGNKINTISPGYAKKLGFKVWQTNIEAPKINSFDLKIFEIVIADFQIENKISRPKFFQKTFLVANTKYEVALGMLFLKFNSVNMSFGKKTLI